MLKISHDLAAAFAETFRATLDAGTQPATISIWSGPAPEDLTYDVDADENEHLATFTLLRPSFGDPVVESLTVSCSMLPVASVDAEGTGTASFFRLYNGDGSAVLQGNVRRTDDLATDAALAMSTLDVVAGSTISIDSFDIVFDTNAED